MAPLFFFFLAFLCSDYSLWKQCSWLLLFSITFLLLSVPLLCVPTLSVLGCLLSYYTRYMLHHSLPSFCLWKPHCPVIQSAWIVAVRGIPEVQFLLNSICLSNPGYLFFRSIPNSLHKMEEWEQYNNKGRSKRKRIVYSPPVLRSCSMNSQWYKTHSYSVQASNRNRKDCMQQKSKRTELVFLHNPVQINFKKEQQLYGTKSSTLQTRACPTMYPYWLGDFTYVCLFHKQSQGISFWFL